MPISLTMPLQRAWGRMERMLFRPFRIRMWLVLGFAAFLSEYLSGRRPSQFGFKEHGPAPWHSIGAMSAGVFGNPALIAVAICVGALALIAIIVLQWVSCRGRFIFLDGVVHERAAIVEPWRRYSHQGNSLFAWTLVFLLVVGLLLLLAALPFLATLQTLWADNEFNWVGVASLGGFLLLAFPIGLATAYTLLFLNHFVVPIMYRHNLGATAAWGRFLVLFRAHPWWFLAYGLLTLVLWVGISTVAILLGVFTCCVGFLLLLTPYIGDVVMLPATVLLRGFGPEFLAQFGPEYDLFAGGTPV